MWHSCSAVCANCCDLLQCLQCPINLALNHTLTTIVICQHRQQHQQQKIPFSNLYAFESFVETEREIEMKKPPNCPYQIKVTNFNINFLITHQINAFSIEPNLKNLTLTPMSNQLWNLYFKTDIFVWNFVSILHDLSETFFFSSVQNISNILFTFLITLLC